MQFDSPFLQLGTQDQISLKPQRVDLWNQRWAMAYTKNKYIRDYYGVLDGTKFCSGFEMKDI